MEYFFNVWIGQYFSKPVQGAERRHVHHDAEIAGGNLNDLEPGREPVFADELRVQRDAVGLSQLPAQLLKLSTFGDVGMLVVGFCHDVYSVGLNPPRTPVVGSMLLRLRYSFSN